jgi:small subunit ribosomal protein S3
MARGAHKVNPIGFRLGINKNWNSRWYADKKNYPAMYLQDRQIRKHVESKLKSAGVASIVVKRLITKVIVEISVAKPGLVIGRGGAGIQTLKDDLNKLLKQNVDIKILEVQKPETVAKLVAEVIAQQCEKRANPKMAAQKAVDAAKENDFVKGIEVWIGGRIKGVDMARRERVKWGNVPRHTLRADIDYGFAEASVPAAGLHGVKVWIYKGEKSSYAID